MEPKLHCDTTGPHGSKGIGDWLGWLGLTAPTALGLLRVSSHVPLNHLGSGLSFKWKELHFSSRHPWPKQDPACKIPNILGLLPNKQPLQISLAVLVFLTAASHLPSNTGAQGIPPVEKNRPSCPCTYGQIWYFPPKFPIHNGVSQRKAARTDRSGWPCPRVVASNFPADIGAP